MQYEASTQVIAMVAITDSLSADGFLLEQDVFSQETVNHLIGAIESLLQGVIFEDLVHDERGYPIKIRYPLPKHPSFLDALANPSLKGRRCNHIG